MGQQSFPQSHCPERQGVRAGRGPDAPGASQSWQLGLGGGDSLGEGADFTGCR